MLGQKKAGGGAAGNANLARIMDVPAAERAELLRRKLTLCSATFEFRTEYIVDQPNEAALKNAKRETLLELIEFVNTKKSFPEEVYKDTLKMVKVNLFQPLPPTPAYFSQHVDEEESPVLQPSWPHLQLVYEFFLRFVVSSDVDPKAAKKVIDKGFIAQLLVLFESEDPRERDYLKTILHRITVSPCDGGSARRGPGAHRRRRGGRRTSLSPSATR